MNEPWEQSDHSGYFVFVERRRMPMRRIPFRENVTQETKKLLRTQTVYATHHAAKKGECRHASH